MSNRQEKNNNGFFAALIGKRTSEKTAGLIYTVASLAIFGVSFCFLFLFVGLGETSQWRLYLNYLAAPLAFFLTGFWYFSYTKTSLKGFIKEQKCATKYYLIAIALQIGLFSLAELNGIFLKFLERFGYKASEIILPSMDGFGFVGVLFAIAVIPAIMEEFLFRGIFLRETKNFSTLARVLVCGGLFALYHQNPAQTIYQFICGAAFTLVAVKSRSFFPTMLSHFINNGIILLLTKFGISTYPPTIYVSLLVVSGICLVGVLVYLLVFDRAEEEKEKGSALNFFACASLGIALLLLSWLATLFMGA